MHAYFRNKCDIVVNHFFFFSKGKFNFPCVFEIE